MIRSETPHQRTRVKVCGITNLDDALCAVAAGADALGFVFWSRSPRHVLAETAADICAALPPFVTRVGVLVDPTQPELDDLIRRVPLDMLQFHGDESPEFCDAQPRAYYKALRMAAGVDVNAAARQYNTSCGLLVDSYVVDKPGGSGRSFDWQQLPKDCVKPIILAGGLAASNVEQAIRQVRPYAVDVSSGVEKSKGRKDPERMRQFFDAVKAADTERRDEAVN